MLLVIGKANSGAIWRAAGLRVRRSMRNSFTLNSSLSQPERIIPTHLRRPGDFVSHLPSALRLVVLERRRELEVHFTVGQPVMQ